MGREVGGFEFPFLWPEGEGSRLFSNTPLLLPRTCEEGVLNSFSILARRGLKEVLSLSPLWPEGRGRRDACLSWFDGGRACMWNPNSSHVMWKGRFAILSFRGRVGDCIPEGQEDDAGQTRRRQRQDRKEKDREMWMISKFIRHLSR